jgi:hypothetical protein
VYTQTTDVEGEVNGLMTYDRKIIRMDEKKWKEEITALYAAAEARASLNGTSYVVMRDEEMDSKMEGLQKGMLWENDEE